VSQFHEFILHFTLIFLNLITLHMISDCELILEFIIEYLSVTNLQIYLNLFLSYLEFINYFFLAYYHQYFNFLVI